MGGLFTSKQRLVAFARMNIVSNLSDIVTPLAIGWLFFIDPTFIPIVAGLLGVTNFLVPQPKIVPQSVNETPAASLSLFTNLKKVLVTRPVYLAILIGAAIHSILFVFDLIIPITGTGFNLTSTHVGTILSTLALSQAVASTYLSMKPFPSETLFNHFLEGLFLGSIALLFAFMTQGFLSLLSQAVASTYLSMKPFPSETLFNHFLEGLFLGSIALLFAFMTQGFLSLLIATLIIASPYSLRL